MSSSVLVLEAELLDLRRQVLRLEQKLGDLHGTDVTSLWRAYRTLCEHVESLEVESRGISNSIDSMRTSVVTVEEAAHEIAVSSGLLFALNLARTALKGFNIKGVPFAAVGGLIVAFRLGRGLWKGIVSTSQTNQRVRAELQREWSIVQDRIAIMASLAEFRRTLEQASEQAAAGGTERAAEQPYGPAGDLGTSAARAAPEEEWEPRGRPTYADVASAPVVENPAGLLDEEEGDGMGAGLGTLEWCRGGEIPHSYRL